MKEGIHPEYKATTVLCACGAEIKTRSVRGDFHVEICSSCHPFFTGKQKIMDTAGRIEKFKNRYGNASSATISAAPDLKAAPAAAPAKKADPGGNRAAKRAKTNAGKPKKVVEAAPAPAETPAADAPAAE